jgi:hypothetical protein
MTEILKTPHIEDGHESPISQRWKWMTVLGNAAIGACELVTSGTSTLSVASDGLHNIGDTATYYMQSENILNPNLNEKRKTRMRKLTHWIIAATSLGVSVKAGIDLGLQHENTPDPLTVYTASASLALNGLMLARIRQRRQNHEVQGNVHERDLNKHFLAVDIPSAGLALAGAVLQKYNIEVEQVAAVASGAVGAYAFRPTKDNLAHNCLGHSHSPHSETHEHHEHEESHSAETTHRKHWFARMTYKGRHRRERSPSRLRRAVGLGTAALALAGGLLSGDTHVNKEEAKPMPSSGISTSETQQPHTDIPTPSFTQPTPITECIPILPGDSEWKIVERQTIKATGKHPSVATTNAIVMFSALDNKQLTPNPDSIKPGDCLEVPTLATTRILYDALEHSDASKQQLSTDLETLNNQPHTTRILQKQAEHDRIIMYVEAALVQAN